MGQGKNLRRFKSIFVYFGTDSREIRADSKRGNNGRIFERGKGTDSESRWRSWPLLRAGTCHSLYQVGRRRQMQMQMQMQMQGGASRR